MVIRKRTEERELEHAPEENEHPHRVERSTTGAPEHEILDSSAVQTEEHVTSATADPWSVAGGWLRVLALFIGLVLVAMETAFGFRLAFLLGGANPNNGFVDFIYDVTDPFVEPFQGIFANEAVNGGIFEPATLLAMAVYLIAAALIMAAIFVLTTGPSTRGERLVTSHTRHRDYLTRGH